MWRLGTNRCTKLQMRVFNVGVGCGRRFVYALLSVLIVGVGCDIRCLYALLSVCLHDQQYPYFSRLHIHSVLPYV